MNKFIPLGALVLMTASCAGPQVSQEVRRIIPLIKAEKYDEAAAIDTDSLAPAFIEALREMKAEGADPKRIIAVADFFFDNYPFCAKDLAIDEARFEAVAEAHAEAASASPLPECRMLDAAGTIQDKSAVLEGWTQTHEDGGRCARELTRFVQRLIDRSPRGEGEESPVRLVRELVHDSGPSMGRQPHYFLLALKGARLAGLYGVDRWDHWAKFLNELADGRWERAFYLRRAWLSGHRQRPFFDVLDPACELLASSRLDRRLQELGRALQKMAAYPDPLNSSPENLKGWEVTVPAVVKWGAGTPFPDLTRYGLVACMAEQVRLEEAAGWVRSHLHEFDNPLRAAYSLLYLIDWEWSRIGDNPPHESLLRLAREALDIAPQGSSAVQALVYLALGSQANGRDSEMVDLLQRALAIPRSGSREFQDESAEFARSEAGRMLARHYQKVKDWPKAIDAWKSWASHSFCVTCNGYMEEEKNLSLASAYEALGRVRDSAEYFWMAAVGQGVSAVDSAKKVKAIHASLGSVPELVEKVRLEVKEVGGDPPAGLKWLAEDLGVPLK